MKRMIFAQYSADTEYGAIVCDVPTRAMAREGLALWRRVEKAGDRERRCIVRCYGHWKGRAGWRERNARLLRRLQRAELQRDKAWDKLLKWESRCKVDPCAYGPQPHLVEPHYDEFFAMLADCLNHQPGGPAK